MSRMGELRRICWLPDGACLKGECIWCQGSPSRTLAEIEEWCATAGQISIRRGERTQDAMTLFVHGLENDGPGVSARFID